MNDKEINIKSPDEVNINNQKSPKSGKLAIIVLSAFLILAIGAAVTFGVLWATKKTDTPTTSNNTEVAQSNASSVTDCQTSTIDQNQRPEDEECACPELVFSDEAVVNKQENTAYSASISDSFYSNKGIVATASSHWDKTVNIAINWSHLNSIFNQEEEDSPLTQSYEINFVNNVADIFLAQFGQSYNGGTFLFLLEDGTVEYMPLQAVYKTKEIKSYGKIPGLTGIRKFYHGSSSSISGHIGGGWMAFAQAADGKIYQLYTILQEAGAWN